MIAEYVGLTNNTIALIERRRRSPDETREDIIVRSLTGETVHSPRSVGVVLGQGVELYVGERPALFFNKEEKRQNKPLAVAEIRDDGMYLDGQKVPNSRMGNPLDPAMKLVQKRVGDLNAEGNFTSRSAWRQWHVFRQGRFISLEDLQDPGLSRRRGQLSVDSPAELGL